MDSHEILTDAALDSCTESQYNVPDGKISSEQRPKTTESFRNAESTTSSQHKTTHSLMKSIQTAQPIDSYDDSNYSKFLQFFPEELQEDNIDILIINALNDQDAAEEFKRHLENDIIVYVNKTPLRPRVKLLAEFVKGSSQTHLDYAFEKTLYVFLFVTKDFCECTWTLLQGQACLTEAIHDPDKKWCVIPVNTKSRKNMNYKLPMMLGSLRPINYWKDNADQFYTECVRKLIDSKLSLLVQRDQMLEEKRQEYFSKHKESIVKQYYDLQARLTNTHKVPVNISVAKESEPLSYCVESTAVQDNFTSNLQQLTLYGDGTSTRRDSQQHKLQSLKEYTNENVSLSTRQISSTSLPDEGFLSNSVRSIPFSNSSSKLITSPITVDSLPSVTQCETVSVLSTGNSVTVDNPSGFNQCKNVSMPSTGNSETMGILHSVIQSTNLTMTFNDNSITVDGPPSACKNNITPSSGEVSEGRSSQTPSVYPNYSVAPSMPLHFSSPCIMGRDGIMYTPTPFGYLPVLPANQHMNTNVHQATTFSNGSVLQGTPSQSTQSSLNSSMQPNLSEPSTSHQMSNASFPPFNYNPYSGFYMHSFPALVTGHGNPSLASQGFWSQQNQPNLQPQETSSQPNRFSQHIGQTSTSSSSQKAFYHPQSSGQVDGAGDAKYYSISSSGPVQHIHHHHYKEVKIEKATNVVIGEKAKVFNTLESSAVSEKSDQLSGPSNVDDENFIIGNSDSPDSVHPNNNTQHETSRLGQSVPSADCNQELLTSPKEFMGFPECPDPCSIPHTTENPNSQMNWNSDETTPKKID